MIFTHAILVPVADCLVPMSYRPLTQAPLALPPGCPAIISYHVFGDYMNIYDINNLFMMKVTTICILNDIGIQSGCNGEPVYSPPNRNRQVCMILDRDGTAQSLLLTRSKDVGNESGSYSLRLTISQM